MNEVAHELSERSVELLRRIVIDAVNAYDLHHYFSVLDFQKALSADLDLREPMCLDFCHQVLAKLPYVSRCRVRGTDDHVYYSSTLYRLAKD